MRAVVKKHSVQVRLSDQDSSDLGRAAKMETVRRGELVGAGTLLREMAMPRVREIVAATKALVGERRATERRSA